MFDFNDEIKKYKPVAGVDEVENVINDEIRDMMDLLQHITLQMREIKE